MLMLGPGDTMTEKADMMQENLEEEQNPLPPNPKKALGYDWKLINFIKKNTKLPIILKGILTKEDAIKCVKKK